MRKLPSEPNKPDRPLLVQGVDLPAAEVINPDADHPILLVCEHAGRDVPQALNRLGLPAKVYDLHVSHDVGAEKVARQLALGLGSTLVLQRYSRLVIDCNRPPGGPTSIPEISDDIAVPGNIGLQKGDRWQRETEVFEPFCVECIRHISQPHIAAAFSIHSFTRVLGQKNRPWDIGFLYRSPASRGQELADLCARIWPDLVIGYNAPYSIEDDTDWFIPVCAEPRQVPHCLIEIRNDLISTDADCAKWANRLHHLFAEFMEQTNA